jgi:pimeloyl-ACP methyl ester carboxylesterase
MAADRRRPRRRPSFGSKTARFLSTLLSALAILSASPVEARPPVPVIFLYGFGSDASTWVPFGDVLERNAWTFGGCPLFDRVNLRVTNLCGSSIELTSGDFYRMQFSNNQDLTIAEQADELQAAITAVLLKNPDHSSVILAAHSMGGLAARSYLQFHVSPNSLPNVIKLITVGTPHAGTELAVLCQQAAPLCAAVGLTPSSVAVGELRPGSPTLDTLNDLTNHPLPSGVAYVSVIGTGTDVIASPGLDGDGIVTAQSQNLGPILENLEPSLRAGVNHTAVGIPIEDRADCDPDFTPFFGHDINPLPNETHTCETTDSSVWTSLLSELQFTPSQRTLAAVLPSSRSVQVGATATAFATIINLGPGVATNCEITPLSSVPALFAYQTTDPATNQVTGSATTPVDVAVGAAQSFVIAFTPTAAFLPTDVHLSFHCANSDRAPIQTGLNTLLLSASATPVPDLVALAATLTNDGIVDIPGTTGRGAFAVATANVGAGETITASADTGTTLLPVSLVMCETDPASGGCLAPPAGSVTTAIGSGATSTFGIFVTGGGPVPFDPANNRVFLRFRDPGGAVRGSTSVAVRTQ